MARSKAELIRLVEKGCLKSNVGDFEVGDTVEVRTRFSEGEKERVQGFSGIVIARRGRGAGASFTVRRVIGDEGVERIFPLHSPSVVAVEVRKRGKVRRAKLYYLRGRSGRRARLAERRTSAPASKSSDTGGTSTENGGAVTGPEPDGSQG